MKKVEETTTKNKAVTDNGQELHLCFLRPTDYEKEELNAMTSAALYAK